MRKYVVYLPAGNNVSFFADRIDLISNKITFLKNGKRVAFFNLNNICGWWEHEKDAEPGLIFVDTKGRP